jgi:methylase of polypeptide subunit release factors
MGSLKTVRYGDIVVRYFRHLDGGGRWFGQDFVPVVRSLFGKLNAICEFASGPGFIGFSLLAEGLCERLTLVDCNRQAIELCLRTAEYNGLTGRVSAYVSDCLKTVPDIEKWDLVVGNPPHFEGSREDYVSDSLSIDPNWSIHRQFYRDVPRFLSSRASVLLLENLEGSSPNTWSDMIESSGLELVNCFRYKKPPSDPAYARNRITAYSEFTFSRLRWLKRQRPGLRRVVDYVRNVERCFIDPTYLYPFYFVWSRQR